MANKLGDSAEIPDPIQNLEQLLLESPNRGAPQPALAVILGAVLSNQIPVKGDSGPVVTADYSPPPLRKRGPDEIRRMALAIERKFGANAAATWLKEVAVQDRLTEQLRAQNDLRVNEKISGHFLVEIVNGVIVEAHQLDAKPVQAIAAPEPKPTLWQKVKTFFQRGNL